MPYKDPDPSDPSMLVGVVLPAEAETMTDTMNGYPVVAQSATPADSFTLPGRVILVDRGTDAYHRWVTAWAADDCHQWCWGHYFDNEGIARQDYDARVARGY